MARARALAHPLTTTQTDLAIQLHGVNTPALPATGKGRHTGRVLLRRSGVIPPLPWSTFSPPFARGNAPTRSCPIEIQSVHLRRCTRWPLVPGGGNLIRWVGANRRIRLPSSLAAAQIAINARQEGESYHLGPRHLGS